MPQNPGFAALAQHRFSSSFFRSAAVGECQKRLYEFSHPVSGCRGIAAEI